MQPKYAHDVLLATCHCTAFDGAAAFLSKKCHAGCVPAVEHVHQVSSHAPASWCAVYCTRAAAEEICVVLAIMFLLHHTLCLCASMLLPHCTLCVYAPATLYSVCPCSCHSVLCVCACPCFCRNLLHPASAQPVGPAPVRRAQPSCFTHLPLWSWQNLSASSPTHQSEPLLSISCLSLRARKASGLSPQNSPAVQKRQASQM